jgi:isoleucyl-tRNA synthetase
MRKDQKSQFAQIEEEILRTWDKEKTFEKSLAQRKGGKLFSFYDGPPFANGLPHFGHSLVAAVKDSVLRYKTMRGYFVPRRNGWDCHGLPVEFAIEKKFGISGKKQITELGIGKFNDACKASIFRYKSDWEEFLGRIGRWSEYDNYYATVDTNYTESVWWAMSQIHEKGLLYKGYKSMPYCPRCETPLSNFEVNEGYRDNVADPSLFVKVKLSDEDAYLLIWTTTPWTLPANSAIAVSPAEQYVFVEISGETLVLAKKRLSVLDETDYTVQKEVKGEELVGKRYQPLFELPGAKKQPNHQNLYKVWPAGFVSTEDGTGLLHVAPAFGEDDLNLGSKHDIPVLQTVDQSGHIKAGSGLAEITGMFFKKADRPIIEHLAKEGLVFAAETLHHTYPFCYRCDSPLLYYAISTWFIKVSAIKDRLLGTAEDISWTPDNIKQGRFGKWLEGARDWAISRNRYWGAPMPVWVNQDDENDYIVVDSIETLQKLAGKDAKLDDLHRPAIDKVGFTKDGKRYKRVEEVIDCWFESGSMAVAQVHYPFENKELFKKSAPADFIIEGLDQTRLWFYVQHVVSTILFDKPAYKNVVVNGIVTAADGQKLSKRLKNYPPTGDVFDREGADSWRLYLLSSHQATETAGYMRFDRGAMRDVQRNIIGTLYNTYKFFDMYARIDKWQPPKKLSQPKADNVLDKWILSRLNQTVELTTTKADSYQIAHAIEPIFSLIDDLSNWYVRRSRRRFWKSQDDADKLNAYATLHYVLVRICQLMSPWAPFVPEKIYRDLAAGTDMPPSVHLSDWPRKGNADQKLIDEMAQARGYINQGLAQRAEAGVKVRQPLASVKLPKIDRRLEPIVADELNVREVKSGGKEVAIDTKITPELKTEGIMRDLVRSIQSARKQAGLQVDDRIALSVATKSKEVKKALSEHKDTIMQETLALKLDDTGAKGHKSVAKIEGEEVEITLAKTHFIDRKL